MTERRDGVSDIPPTHEERVAERNSLLAQIAGLTEERDALRAKLANLRDGATEAMSCSHHESVETCDSFECIRKDHHTVSAEHLLTTLNADLPERVLRNALSQDTESP